MKLLFGLAALLAATASAAPQERDTPAPRLARIEVEMTTWGRSYSRWSVDAQGNFAETRPEPNAFQPKQFVTRSYAVGTAGFRKMRVLLGVPETRAGQRLVCTITMTDAPSGTVTWVQPNGRKTALSFYTACREFGTRRVVDQVAKAQQLAEQWAKMGTITQTRAGDATP